MEPSTPPPTAPARTPPWFAWGLAAVVVLFGAVRFACLFNDLWLDEIWSVQLVSQINSPVEILTRLQLDNNHPLNSLFIYLLAPAKADWMYRLLSWFMGTLSVWLAGLIGRRQFQQLHPGESPAWASVAGLITGMLAGGCYFLIHYASEARGYAPAVGFGLLAMYALLRGTNRPGGTWAAVYGGACILGLLAHLVVFQVMLGGLVWSAVKFFRTWKRWRDRLVHLACWQLGPWLFLGLYYFGFVRKVQIGGGPRLALGQVLGTFSAFCLGFPAGAGRYLALPVFLGLVLVALGLLWRRNRAWAGFYATGIFIAPALGLLFSRFVLLYPRYFIVSAALALLLAGYLLTRIGQSGRTGRVVGALVLAGFLIGNGAHAARLLRDGRGQYRAALRYVAAATPTLTITASGDSDFRNFMVMDYYNAAVGAGRRLRYLPGNQLPPAGPQWIFLQRLDDSVPPPAADLPVGDGWHYHLERVFPHAPLSGWTWYVYRNLDPDVLPPAGR